MLPDKVTSANGYAEGIAADGCPLWGPLFADAELRAGGFSHIVLSYEELVLDSPRARVRLTDYLGIPVELDSFGDKPGQLHILRGNSLRHDRQRSSRLVYDYRWFTDPWVHRLGFAFRPLLRWGVRRGLLPGHDISKSA